MGECSQYMLEEENGRFTTCIANNNDIDFLAYSPLSFGILCIDPDKDEEKQNSFLRSLIFKNYKKSTTELRRCLKKIAVSRSVSQAQVAINWCCYQGAIPLVGMRKRSQVIDISNVFKWNLNQKSKKIFSLVVNTRNANAFTGKQGYESLRKLADLISNKLNKRSLI